jgi:hypothetical protein
MKGLNKLYYLKIEIDELKKEIENLSVISSSEMTGMPHSSGISNPTEQYLLKKQKLMDRLQIKLNKYIDELDRIEKFIDGIDEPEVRLIARKRFIQNKKWEEIGREISLDRSVCYRKLNKYIKEVNGE